MEDKKTKLESTEMPTSKVTEDGFLIPEEEQKIKNRVSELLKEKKASKVFPVVVIGDKDNGEKEFYIGYFGQPTFPQFSKFIAAGKKDDTVAIKTLAKDTFIEGDKELVDNDSLFLFGSMPQIQAVMSIRQSYIVNL